MVAVKVGEHIRSGGALPQGEALPAGEVVGAPELFSRRGGVLRGLCHGLDLWC